MKRIVTFLITAIIILSSSVSALAAGCNITIDKVDAAPGDTAYVDFSIADNPGIAAMTISITYDSSVLEYKGYKEGFLSDYTVEAHPSKNQIRFINLEQGNVSKNGIFLTLIFKVSDSAKKGNSKINIAYTKGDFCNWNAESISPVIVSGGVNITPANNECEHKEFSEWKTVSEPGCNKDGLRESSCKNCEFSKTEKISALGHQYDNFWTVDKQATVTEFGHMSRHCKKCEDVTDIKYFSAKQSEENKFNNKEETQIKPNDFTGSITEKDESDNSQGVNSDEESVTVNSDQLKENEKGDYTLIIIIVCVLLIAVGFGIFFYIKRKK